MRKLGIVCVVAVAMLAAPQVGFASGWAVQSVPAPALPNGQLVGVSCSSSTACTAVGLFAGSVGIATLAERWTGSSWAIQRTPNPAGARGSVLQGVSCTAATACIAVGDVETSTGTFLTLAERWNGTNWSIQRTPNPSGATYSALNGVSCASATACTAVGSSGSAALAERWDGTRWSVQTTPNPTGARESVLTGVSCASASACTAVGQYTDSTGAEVTLAEVWNGSGWALQTTPNPVGARDSVLSGVSCVVVSTCVAVGSYYNSANVQVTLAEGWNGSGWSIQTTPNPAAAASSVLYGVSCTSVMACTAVGLSIPGSGPDLTLAEGWNGSSWTIESTPNPTSATTFNGLEGVSCTSATACTAVGLFSNKAGTELTLGEAWNGSSWAIGNTRNPVGAASSELNGVSCSSTTACTAVGDYANTAGVRVALAEVWNGTGWTIQRTPNPTGATRSALTGISCTTATACTAVGYFINAAGDTYYTLAERWDGSSWKIQTTANPGGATYSVLDGVSCTTATDCTAVGEYANTAGFGVALAEAWNGTGWSIQSTPNPAPGSAAVLEAVSCASATACTAVGYCNSCGPISYTTLAEGWNGSSWSIQSTPNPSPMYNELHGVSCTSGSACTGVGQSDRAPLAERWDGTSWSVQTTPNPNPTGDSNVLSGVACPSTSACTTVGSYYTSSGTEVTLAEAWNGSSWAIQSTPTPTGAGALDGVSCTSTTACTAVGLSITSSGQVPLAERYS